jgi:hypothetical protein
MAGQQPAHDFPFIHQGKIVSPQSLFQNGAVVLRLFEFMCDACAHADAYLTPGHEGIAILMVPESSDLMRHYEEAAARGELEEEYDGLEITLEEAANAGVSFRPTGADDSFKEEYLFCKPACHLEVAMLVNGSEYVKVMIIYFFNGIIVSKKQCRWGTRVFCCAKMKCRPIL